MVAAVTALVVIAPLAPRFIPARASDISASDLLQSIDDSRTTSWSGDVTTQGTLQIPDTDSFAGVAELLGEQKDVRVWWRGPESWRVDRVRQTGETGLIREGNQITSWVFESARATVSPYSPVRLPDVSDLLPNQLAQRLLAGATDDELSRLPAQRIAGRDAPGLRLTPRDDQSTIGRVDVWADADTGLPLQVEVTGVGADQPVLRSEVDRLDLGPPDPDTTTFTAPPDAEVRTRDAIDLAAGANVFAPFTLPDSVADLQRRGGTDDLGAVGIYGRGPTALVAIPLRRDIVDRARDQFSAATTAEQTDAGTSLSIGPLSILLTSGDRGRGTFLLAGTVTPETLTAAADELAEGVQVQ